ncbi:MAG TPA: metallophosphoesterase, partial [Polyangiaceae bacterium]|nr:metallophosphoesterase [Polyangiaceae bacterium]
MRAGVMLCLVALSACKPDAEKERPPAKTAEPKKETAPTPVTRYPAARRVVAIGDVHGDIAATRAVLRLAGLMDEKERWSGGDSVLVQTGDVLDRGDGEQAILDLLAKLQTEAASANGKVVLLNGNHELMNVAGDFRYVTPGGFLDFTDVPDLALGDPLLADIPDAQRARAAAFRPGGIYARKLADHPIAVVIGETAFAHGGILPS